MKDFLYKQNDIIIALIILIIAGFLIYDRIGIIMDYPAQLAQQQEAKAEASQQIEEGEAVDASEEDQAAESEE